MKEEYDWYLEGQIHLTYNFFELVYLSAKSPPIFNDDTHNPKQLKK